MYKFLAKNGEMIAFGLGVLVTVIFLANVIPNAADFNALPEKDPARYASSIFNFGLTGAIALAAIAAVCMLFFGLFHTATNFKNSLMGIIGLVVLVGIFFVSYSMASGEVTPFIKGAVEKFEDSGNGTLSAGNLKFISGGISTVLILLALAVAAFVLSEIRNFFK